MGSDEVIWVIGGHMVRRRSCLISSKKLNIFQPKGGVQDMSYIEAERMSFNQIFDRDEDEYLEGDELLYWVS